MAQDLVAGDAGIPWVVQVRLTTSWVTVPLRPVGLAGGVLPGSSSKIVPAALVSDPNSAFCEGALNVSVKVSSSSLNVSSSVDMPIVFTVSPGANVSVWAEAGA